VRSGIVAALRTVGSRVTHAKSCRSASSNGSYDEAVTRSIQSVERAVAILRLLAGAGGPLRLSEIAGTLGLAKPTAFGIVRTLVDAGFVQQDHATSDYSLGDGVRHLERAGIDPNDLRSLAMNWADALASRTRLEVLIAVPQHDGARIVHHVFRPDDSDQHLRVDEVLPLHATALGKVVLAFAAGIASPTPGLERYTQRTLTHRLTFEAEIARVRERGWASEQAELVPGTGAVSVPLRGYGGLGVGAVAVSGPLDRVFRHAGGPRDEIVAAVVETAGAISRSLGLRDRVWA
jgi:DNA-binding IclR family transcriptional regulator